MKVGIVKGIIMLTISMVVACGTILGAAAAAAPKQAQVDLSKVFNTDGFAFDSNNIDGDIDNNGCTISADKVPAIIKYKGTSFKMGPMADGKLNVVKCKAQTIPLPAGKYKKLKFIGVATNGDKTAEFKVNYTNSKSVAKSIKVVDWCFPDKEEAYKTYRHAWLSGTKFINDTKHVVGFHEYTIDLSNTSTVKNLVLPSNNNIKVFAITLLPK